MSETVLAAFPTVLVAIVLWEVAAPRRRREIPRVICWTNNLALLVLDTAILRLSFPIIAVGIAEERGWGLFNNNEVPVWLAGRPTRDQLELRLQPAVVGPAVGYLHRRTGEGA